MKLGRQVCWRDWQLRRGQIAVYLIYLINSRNRGKFVRNLFREDLLRRMDARINGSLWRNFFFEIIFNRNEFLLL